MADAHNADQSSGEETEPDKPIVDDDPATDRAVEDIVRNEGDDELKAQDAAAGEAVVMKLSVWERFKNSQADWWGNPRKKWSTILLVLLIIAAVFAVPISRYEVLGLFVQENITVRTVDSKSGEPVSAARVQVGNVAAETNGEGAVTLRLHAGVKKLEVTKDYYAGSKQSVLVTLSTTHNVFKMKLVALGRQVKVKVNNTITGKPLEDAEVTAGAASARTNSAGTATLVLASNTTTQAATVSSNGYNTANVTVTAAGPFTKNTFRITPSGKVYFLSDLTGTINVVGTNLDGSDRQTVLAGTGSENPNDTEVMASPDWKYVALLAQRSGTSPSLYVINTTNGNQLTTVDNTNGTFNLIGWSGDTLVYQIVRSGVSNWQAGQQELKAYSPITGQTLLLDQTQATGTNEDDFVMQFIGQAYIMNGQVVYVKGWQAGDQSLDQLTSKSAELDTINPDGSDHKVVQTFSVSTDSTSKTEFLNLATHEAGPDSLYLLFQGDTADSFYTYANGQLTTNSTLNDDNFYSTTYPTYITSPSGISTFWAELRDGKNTLFTGSASGGSQQQIASASSFSPYGWYTDDYLLVTQNNDVLYIMPTSGGTPLLVSDYFSSAALNDADAGQ